jgi:hypothetical protein
MVGSSLTSILQVARKFFKLCEAYPFFEKGGTVLKESCYYGELTTGYKTSEKYSLRGTVGYSSLRSNDFTEGETLTKIVPK